MGEGLAATSAPSGAQQCAREAAKAIGEARGKVSGQENGPKMCQDASQNPQNALKPVGNSLDEELGIEKTRESDF